jgi:FAD/FMN-containing dehydrogenase
MHFARWTFLAIAHLALGNPSAQAAPPSTLSACLNSKNVPIRLMSSPDFAQRSRPFNLRLRYTPAVIVLPTTVKHVSDAVVCASKNGVKVQAKSGGHSYASYAFGGRDGIMTIDLESFQEISLDANFVAKVGGGVRLGNLAHTIFNKNNSRRALSHGTCPGVGIGGHATHGGFGYSSRNWGLALDSITAMDVVLANGSSIRTTRKSYPDIFYVRPGDWLRV